jgi:hypothetical protein
MGKRGNNIPAEGWAQTVSAVASSLDQYSPDSWEDCAGEIADGLVPVYYREKWQEMNDLALWADDDAEQGADELLTQVTESDSPLWSVLDAYLYSYYLNAVNVVVSYINETEEAGN